MFRDGPVHWLENVDGDPRRVRTACGNREWKTSTDKLLDPNRDTAHTVTCQECLAAMKKLRGDRTMLSFAELMAKTNLPRMEVMFRRGPSGEEQFQWGVTDKGIPILTAIGMIVRVQGELPLLEPGDEDHACDRQSLILTWDAATRTMRWFVGEDIPLYPLLGMLDTIKDLLVSGQLAQRAGSQQSRILGPNGAPIR